MVISVTFGLKMILKGFLVYFLFITNICLNFFKNYASKMLAINLTLQQVLTEKLETKPQLSLSDMLKF